MVNIAARLALPGLLLLLPGLTLAHGTRHQANIHWSLNFGSGYYAPFHAPFYSSYVGPGWRGYWGGPSLIYSAPLYTSPPVIVQSSPPVYIEKPALTAEASAAGWWYFCPPTGSYYPYVNDCSEAWQKVPPVPPTSSGSKP